MSMVVMCVLLYEVEPSGGRRSKSRWRGGCRGRDCCGCPRFCATAIIIILVSNCFVSSICVFIIVGLFDKLPWWNKVIEVMILYVLVWLLHD